MRPPEPSGADRSLPDLLRRLLTDTGILVRQEVELARTELAQRAKVVATASVSFGASALFGIAAFGAFSVVFIAILGLVLPMWAAMLLVAILYLGIGAIVISRLPAMQKKADDRSSQPSPARSGASAQPAPTPKDGSGKRQKQPLNIALLKATWSAFGEDKAPRLASAIAYSAIFSIAPLFIVLIAIVGWFIGVQNGGHGHHVAEDLLVGQVQNSAGSSTAATVRQMIAASFNKPRQSVIAQVIGWVTFVLGATALFAALQDALNAVWHVEAIKGGWKQMLRDRIASFGMILIVGFLLLLSLVANIAISFLGSHLLGQIPLIGNPIVLAIVGQLVTLGVVTLIFAAIFKVLPDVNIAWSDVWIGAIATAVLFVVGEAAIALYFKYAGVASAYGAAGSLLVAILWIYYSAILLLLGAEFTKVHAGHVQTDAPTTIRSLTDHPAGIDPRVASQSP